MGFSKSFRILLLCVIPMVASSQECGTILRNTKNKNRNYYLRDTLISVHNFEKIKPYIKSTDTTLVKHIIEKGAMHINFLDFFQKRSIQIKVIGRDEFWELPLHQPLLSRKEKRRLKKLELLYAEYEYVLINEKPTAPIHKKISKRKYLALQEKVGSVYPFLFEMYPIYTYQNFTLLIYSIYTQNRRRDLTFVYEICEGE